MGNDVTIYTGNGPPVQGIDLPSLNNVLVNVYLDPAAYERRNKELIPVQCSSLRSAAYLFELAVTISPPEVDGVPVGDALPDGDVEQSVDYWRYCSKDADLVQHFAPSGVVTAMRPKRAVDRLGTLIRLRITEETYLQLSAQADAGKLDVLLSTAGADAVKMEKSRLKDTLTLVRAAILDKMSAEPPFIYENEKGEKIALSVPETTMENLRGHYLAGPKRDEVSRLMDKRTEYDRLTALVQPTK